MTKYKFQNLFFILPVLFIFFGGMFFHLNKATKLTKAHGENYVEINGAAITVMIADEPQEQWQGLSDRQFLGAYNGMLFVFPEKQVKNFVMRRMHFPLDIIFIEDNKIVNIHRRLEPEGPNPVKRYSSDRPVNYVLEVNGGFCDAFGIKEGDEVAININSNF